MDGMKSVGTLRDVKDGRIKPPCAIRTRFGYFEFCTLNRDWWVGNGTRSYSCTPDTPVFVFNTVVEDDLPMMLRPQAD